MCKWICTSRRGELELELEVEVDHRVVVPPAITRYRRAVQCLRARRGGKSERARTRELPG